MPELLDLFISERIVLLHSPSGAGKTSLIQAGLLPELKKNKFFVWPVLRVDLGIPQEWEAEPRVNRYVASIAQSIESCIEAEQANLVSQLASNSLQKTFDTLRPDDDQQPVFEVLIFDQFEEIFTVDPTDRVAKQEFFRQVGKLLSNRNRWALFAIREEYIAALNPYQRTIPTRLNIQFRLELLDKNKALRAIQEPAKAQRVVFESAAATTLVDDLRQVQVQMPDGITQWRAGPYVEPVQLQVVCRRLWENRKESGRISDRDIGELEDVNAALAAYYAESVAEVAVKTGCNESKIRNWFESALITKEGVRSRILKGPRYSEGLDNSVIHELVNTHIIRVEESQYRTWFELSHDRLVEPIRVDNEDWRQTNLTRWQRQAALWSQQGQPDSLLLPAEQVNEAKKWAERHAGEISPVEEQCIRRSASRQHERQMRRWIALSVSIAFMLLAIGLLNLFTEIRSNLPWAYFHNLETGKTNEVFGNQATLGRSTEFENTVTVTHRSNYISRMHLIVTRDHYAFDMRSLNGTTINAEFLPYGQKRKLESGDILVLAGVAALQFQLIDYPFYQYWQPNITDFKPNSGWLLFIDGTNHKIITLTGERYFLHLDENGLSRLSPVKPSDALLRIDRIEIKHKILRFIPCVFDEKDAHPLLFRFKGDDYVYPTCEIPAGFEFTDVRSVPWQDRYGRAMETDIYSINGVFRYEKVGLKFQLVPIGLNR